MKLLTLPIVALLALAAPAPSQDAETAPLPEAVRPDPGEAGAGWRLASSQSPYLEQHADNTVAWYPWGDEAFAVARERGVPVFLSVGYSSCHWCHVMEHESFEDAEIGALLGEHFVAVKLDREQHPDVDAHFMKATTAMNQGRGGWPMSVFMTPDAEPFFTGTYFPPREAFGRPGFLEILRSIVTDWTSNREALVTYAGDVHEFVARDRLGAGRTWTTEDVGRAARGLAASLDPVHGGHAGAPKFPPTQVLRLLVARHLRGDDVPLDAIVRTLDGMAWGGLRDHVGGGFHRYTVDDAWRIPHFEKMLYDNAQLLESYAAGYALTGEERFARVVRDTFAWAEREMRSEIGLYMSAQDADSLPFDAETLEPLPDAHIEEGLFHAWSRAQLDAALGDDAARAAELLGVTEGGTFEAGLSHVQPRRTPDERAAWHAGVDVADLTDDQRAAADAWWDDVRRRLADARAGRPRPFLDGKCLASWNGLMLSGLARASRLCDDESMRQATQNLAYAIVRHLMRVRRDAYVGMYHQVYGGVRSGDGNLSAYAAIARGMLDAYEATGDLTLLYQSLRVTREMLELFADDEGGFWQTRGADPLLGDVRVRATADGAVPAGASMAAEVLARLAPLDDTGAFRGAAERAVARGLEDGLASPRAHATLLVAADALAGPLVEVVVAGIPGDPEYDALLATARRRLLPASLLVSDAPAAAEMFEAFGDLPALLANRADTDGGGTAWVCTSGVCRLPVETPAALDEELDAALIP